ncbi:MAG: DUF4097 domain-containing protein [Bacteroidetes bacterium]|nr:DUF4097 domain-containing protein [Bacteroidota bacterium]MBU2586270.1 DUF4097 domain-containing protein [Bacteroidota bacterium]
MTTYITKSLKRLARLSFLLLIAFTYTNLMGCVHISVNQHPDDPKMELIKEKNLPTQEGKNLYLSTARGDVRVKSWDKNEVQVKIFGNQRAKNKMKFTVEASSDGIRVEGKSTTSSWLSFWKSTQVRYEIVVPNKFNCKLSTSGGDLHLDDLNGSVKLSTSGGDIRVQKINGTLDASTSGGDISLSYISGPIKCSTSGGDISVKEAKGNISTSTLGGDISLQCSNGKVSASTSGGDIRVDYSGANQGIKLKTSGGDISLKVDNDFAGNVDLSSLGGDVSCDLSMTAVTKKKSSALIGAANSGGPNIECSTLGGDIRIRKR